MFRSGLEKGQAMAQKSGLPSYQFSAPWGRPPGRENPQARRPLYLRFECRDESACYQRR